MDEEPVLVVPTEESSDRNLSPAEISSRTELIRAAAQKAVGLGGALFVALKDWSTVVPVARSLLTDDEVRERLAFGSEETCKVVETWTSALVQEEKDRQGVLERKATQMFGLITLASSISFGLVGTSGLNPSSSQALLILLQGGAAIGTVIVALQALGVRDHAQVDQRELLASDYLDDANSGDKALVYRRHLLGHLWKVIEVNQAVNDTKAVYVERAQKAAFVYSLLLFALLMSFVWS